MESGQTLKNKNIVMSYGGKRLECVKNTLKKNNEDLQKRYDFLR